MRQSRRTGSLLVAIACSLALLAGHAAGAHAAPIAGSEDAVAHGYHRLLLDHTRWAETTWDEAAGHYQLQDFNFVVVLGNAVLLRFGDYDAEVAGVSRDVLRDHTLRTIAHFAASNRWVDPGGDWGVTTYWDSTFEAYFVAAARLLWDELDAPTRANVDRIAASAADAIAGAGTLSPSTNGLTGGFLADSKIEEMGARTMPLAAALAYLPGDPSSPGWREWLDRWGSNIAGLPPADQANSADLDGRGIADWNRSQNIFDTFIVENHGSFAPHYQQSAAAYPGRNAAQFLIAGRPLPQVLRTPPNGIELLATLRRLGTDAGGGANPMVADRYHLYGRDVLPLAYQSTVLGDRDAARAERMLLEHLAPYQAYPPAHRLAKFSGEPKYEPEARAELAMAYLLHYARTQLAGDVEPVSEREYFQRASGANDFGAVPGLVAHQSPDALAAAVSKPGFVKFAFLPEHDDWLLDPSGAMPSFIPSTATAVSGRSAAVYRRVRDGFDGSATLLRTATGFAGFATLPTGAVVYATSGLGDREGQLRLHNLDMPGVRGLDGERTFHAQEGSVALAGDSGGDGGIDQVRFPPTVARHVRFLGVEPATRFGYSLWDFEVHAGDDAADLARGRPTTASSSYGPGYEGMRATDGSGATRWAVATAERPRGDSWLAVDLGSPQSISRVRLSWESYAARYRIQVSDDGASWRDVAIVPPRHELAGEWLNIDDRVGFVVRGSSNPIGVGPADVALSDGPAAGSAGMVVEARPAQGAEATAASARLPAPSGGPAALRASLADGYLSLFNLGGDAIVRAALRLPQQGAVRLYRGTQRTVAAGTVYDASLAGAGARIEPPRFTLAPTGAGGALPPLEAAVSDSRALTLTNAGGAVARVGVTSVASGERATVELRPGGSQRVEFEHGRRTPSDDVALTRTTFPTSPLPAGMTDPDLAVDGEDGTAWRPGPSGRMVIDLGEARSLDHAVLRWTAAPVPPVTAAVSDDGLHYRDVATGPPGRHQRLRFGGLTARYVALAVDGWQAGDPLLTEASIFETEPAA
jgi:hypothetical protein